MNSDPIRILAAGELAVPDGLEDLLALLDGPVMLHLEGEDRQRCRAVCTLLHGNEPSGVRALHAWLRSGLVPATDTLFFIPGTHIARHERLFHHRFLPGTRDLNRCFRAPFDDAPGQVAGHMMALLDQYRPECLIDIHNTSGPGPSFAVITRDDQAHRYLAELFTRHLVVTDLQLGSLMELSDDDCPIVTIECGGSADPRADQLAEAGLWRYLQWPGSIRRPPPSPALVEYYRYPLRFESRPGCRIAYATHPVEGVHLTVSASLIEFNFGSAPADTLIGWLDSPQALELFWLNRGIHPTRMADWVYLQGNRLLTCRPLKFFMITLRVDIALSDCLFYLAPAEEPEG